VYGNADRVDGGHCAVKRSLVEGLGQLAALQRIGEAHQATEHRGLSRPGPAGHNPGAAVIDIWLVDPLDQLTEGLSATGEV
jgi:hypothetical protein